MPRTPPIGAHRRACSHATALTACAGLLLAPTAATAQACPCAKRELAAVVKQSDVIFVGKPLAGATDSAVVAGRPAVETQTRFAFEVGLVLKGSTTRAATVVSPPGPCGAGFVVGTEYLVIGTRQGAGIFTDACQGNVAGVAAIRARAAAIRELLQPQGAAPAPAATP
ncbi:hypothetical protein K2Z84_21280 [Candidatus Binatia bacterium]|jgi:hypothetical protein|nr:hypothetical protein [Candidatus Binatia bacterium]